jgi:23S rRNA (pseudouridine1915-N3)-methyltransferase
MLKINIISIGKVKDKYISNGIDEFSKRLSKYVNFNIVELVEEDDNKGINIAISKESNRIMDLINKKNNVYNVLLDIHGEMVSSVAMARKIEELSLRYSEINFIIGGSNGVNEELKSYVDYKISFSLFTFPHQLMKLILSEQIYRWVSINKNIKYHK